MSQGPEPLLDLVVFRLDEQSYALGLPSVERVLPMLPVASLPSAPAVALGVINLHGAAVPVVDARTRLGFPPHDYGLSGHLLVARTARRRLALPVDEVTEVRAVAADAVTRVDALLPGIGHLAGVVALEDGLVFIHDLEGFLGLDEEEQLATALELTE